MKGFIANILFRIIIIILPLNLIGQVDKITSGEPASNRDQDSLIALDLYSNASELFRVNNIPESIEYLNRALELAINGEYISITAECYELLGDIFKRSGDWNNMLLNYLKAADKYSIINRQREAEIYGKLSREYFDAGGYDLSAEYIIKKYQLLSGEQSRMKAEAAKIAARSYMNSLQPEEAIIWYDSAVQCYSRIGDDYGRIECIFQVAGILAEQKKYDEATITYDIIKSYYTRQNDPEGLANVMNNLGYLNFKKGNFREAGQYFIQALEYLQKSDANPAVKAGIYSNLALNYQNLGSREECIHNLEIAIKYFEMASDYSEVARMEHILARIFFNEKDLYDAEYYCLQGINHALQSGNPKLLQSLYQTYSDILESGNDFVGALEYYEMYLGLRDSLLLEEKMTQQLLDSKMESLRNTEQETRLTVADEEIKDLALKRLLAERERQEKQMQLMNSERELEKSENERLRQSMELDKERYNLNLKEKEITSLEQDKEIQRLLLIQSENEKKEEERKNQMLESEKREQALQLEKEHETRKRMIWTIALVAIIAVLILISMITTRRKNMILARQKREIEEYSKDLSQKNDEIMTQNEQIIIQKDIIEQKNMAITDSIQYAKRIQIAVLPPLDILTEQGLNHFIFFRPKDIVSGDFYWGERMNGQIFVAAADCTGHGVPGAFMSMLGITLLHEIVNSVSTHDPGLILNQLREKVIQSLRQRGVEGETKDGMDLALIIIDTLAGEILFSAANNPLYFVRNNDLTKYAGDRMPIGFYRGSDEPFSTRKIKFQKGDKIYIFSDGFADQFGGEFGKKFMYKRFQRLILDLHKLPMLDQLGELERTFDNWKGDLEQVDDVLVVGISL